MNLGLDELMIVNPGLPPNETTWLLGDDGSLYRFDPPNVAGLSGDESVPRYFLGDDGTLYETQSIR